jgi:hypothetical protein
MSIKKFEISMPENVKEWLATYLADNSRGLNILEYGTGGSTFLFSCNPLNFVVACETSAQWLSEVMAEMKTLQRRNILPIHMNIGSTGAWGTPLSYSQQCHLFENAVRHPSRKCMELGFAPDLTLIDGRFRVACFIEALRISKKDSLVLIDDYFDRNEYHVAEQLCSLHRRIGRAALFRCGDKKEDFEQLTQESFMAYYYDPD